MSTEITSLKQLEIGKEYNIYCHQFEVMNTAVLISFDTTILKRDISYWQFSERGYKPINKRQLEEMFIKDQCPVNIFALWGHDLKYNTITPKD